MPSSRPLNRLEFLKTASVAAGSLAWPAIVRAQRSNPLHQRIRVACIGVGGKGRGDTAAAAEHGDLVALCDVDLGGSAAETVKRFPDLPVFTDYRQMFDKMGSQIDAVVISTPDHSHYPAAMAAMMLGKHVFAQKPLANSIWEARQLQLAARHYKVVTQMGIQGHTFQGMRLLREWLEAGAIGDVREVRYWTNRPIWPQGSQVEFNPGERPAGLDWSVWQGPVATERAYSPALHPKKWRGAWDYGCGALGDIGCHLFDAAFWALDLGMPDTVSVEAVSDFTPDVAPAASMLRYRFTKNREGRAIAPVEFVWSDGGLKPSRPAELDANRQLHAEFGQLLHGTRGSIYSPGGYCESLRLIPEEAMRSFARPPQKYPRVEGGPIKEWLDAIRAGTQPGACFEYAARLTEVVLLGNLAIRLGRTIRWDSDRLRVVDTPEADALIKREYRKGWEFPVFA